MQIITPPTSRWSEPSTTLPMKSSMALKIPKTVNNIVSAIQ